MSHSSPISRQSLEERNLWLKQLQPIRDLFLSKLPRLIACLTVLFFLSQHSNARDKTDTTEVQVSLAKAERVLFDSPKEAFELAKKVAQKAQSLGLYKEELKAERVIADYYIYSGMYDSANVYYQRSLLISRKHTQKREEAINLLRMADGYVLSRDVRLAAEYYTTALSLAIRIKEDDLVVGIYNNIAVFYIYEKNWAKALEYLNQGLEFIKTSEKSTIAIKGPFLSNLGVVYEETGKYQESLSYHQQAHTVYLLGNQSYNMALSYHNLGNIYNFINETDTAIMLLEKALEIERASNIIHLEQETLVRISKAYLRNNEYGLAIEMAKEAIRLAQETQNADVLSEGYYQLSLAYSASGEASKSRYYFSRYKDVSDSLIALERNLKIQVPAIENQESEGIPNNLFLYLILVFMLLGLVYLILKSRKKIGSPSVDVRVENVEPKNTVEYLLVTNRLGEAPLKISLIHWLEKDHKRCRVVTQSAEFSISKTITELESILSSDHFFRVNRAAIINLEFLDSYAFWEYDKYVVTMKGADKKTFVMSRDRLKAFTEQLKINGK